jgi:hypothetical protein
MVGNKAHRQGNRGMKVIKEERGAEDKRNAKNTMIENK